jgi:hypothetical protein
MSVFLLDKKLCFTYQQGSLDYIGHCLNLELVNCLICLSMKQWLLVGNLRMRKERTTKTECRQMVYEKVVFENGGRVLILEVVFVPQKGK